MKLIEVDQLLTRAYSDAPSIKFQVRGIIRLNNSVVDKLCPKAWNSKNQIYLHTYTEGADIAVSMDENPTQGLRVRFDGGKDDRRKSKNITISNSAFIKHITSLMDWPLAENKKRIITYTIDSQRKLPGGETVWLLK